MAAHSRHRIDVYGSGRFNEGYANARWLSTKIPAELEALAIDLYRQGVLRFHPDAVTVSEYLPGQGVGLHTDRDDAGPVIVGVALLSACTVRFDDGQAAIDAAYPARSALVIGGKGRHAPWRHSILPVAARRLSIVFRRE